MSSLLSFSPAMQQVLVQAVNGAVGFANDMASDNCKDLQEKSEQLTLACVLDAARQHLAMQLDPDNANEDFVTPAMREALQELVFNRVQLVFK